MTNHRNRLDGIVIVTNSNAIGGTMRYEISLSLVNIEAHNSTWGIEMGKFV